MAHAITVHSDIDSSLLFVRMRASEPLGRLFSCELELISESAEVKLRKLLGTPMAVTLKTDEGDERHFHGIVAEAAQTGFETISKVRYARYRVQLVPKPWLLTHRVDCRIYNAKSVPTIVKDLLGEIGYADVKLSLSGNYAARDYCVQYRESSFDFITRLLEQEGIYYYFTHTASTHTMVLADALGAHAALSGLAQIPYCPPLDYGSRAAASISEWRTAESVHALKCQLTDYDPLNPKTALLGTENIDDGSSFHGVSGLDVFDYPGLHASADDGRRYAQVRVEALNARHLAFEGRTDACGMATGGLFTLKDFPLAELNQEYLVTGTTIELADPGYHAGAEQGVEPFQCRFEAVTSKTPFRNLPSVAKTRVVGLQTAVVCGSDTDEEIAVDKYGRVQVTFHWNKPDKDKAQSSCPVRVASPWAGKNWGAVSIPRVGQEVVVSFLEGDPDRPLIIGSVYNADNLPPYALPDNKTQSGIKSRSLLGGADDANELRFEDKKGSEQLFIHAQKDMVEEVENDHTVTIDHDEISTVKNDQTLTVKHDQTTTVENNQTLTVNNDQTETIKHDRKVTVQNGDTLDVTMNGTTSIGQKFKLDAGTEIELVTGASSIVMKSSGDIEIKGLNIKITASMGVKIEGQVEVGIKAGATMDIGAGASLKAHSDAMLEVAGAAMTTVKGAMTTIKGDAMTQVSGAIIMIG
ncbi:type VI secretion system Vgr family protein [Dyella sp.]|jgi:type VI secretion system secreted protein VgrG|uniref:type VI secretion system Vgr family protein n=1 Tax=Dyella sp. TaxID=1869338 RepID=UPI002D77ED0C|nr:type VI secretion system tip protein TssI/VgrG [Dyella sp.]HET6433614.1 type VI secretion system tip protein TssI/VgrG [Dyella sp.]